MATNTNTGFDQATKQFESLFFGPARAYAAMSIDYTEKLLSTQFDFAKTYSDAALSQARALLDVRDAEGMRTYVEGQQKVVKDLSERFKDDAEKVVSLNQDFAKQSQKLVEDNVKTASKATSQAK
ncbi:MULTISPECIES: phasin family protein [Modicisalibacter]|uniref:phasin family protein n=1 Tax=Modicisalibacter TaxID=574347 RepID=UPI00100B754C|nr:MULTISPECIES: phasin family protein [Halomonadaceae]MBZ9559837.1 phasin family protein [Modicisalibacter sp. R2A 31.J]MBZ9577289.1 phasin family protein [Modicisalibacter sp. MOD 31.J]